ncbi:MAG: thiamine phosphate synthase, partial [Turicibacter sp.]
PHKILGVSAQTVEQAVLAQQQGADYIGVGALFTTNTKRDADSVSLETLKSIVASVTIPVVGIGGINEDNIKDLQGYKLDGVAIVSAIFAKPDVKIATKELKYLTQQIIR